MQRIRVIPILLLTAKGLVKTQQFKNPIYIGDPINAIKIFNEKEVDELIVLDIDASKEKREPHFEIIKNLASECFMPLAYGGGISNLEQVRKLFNLGIEKVSINTSGLNNPNLISIISREFGSQSVTVSVDIKKNIFGKYFVYNPYIKKSSLNPILWAKMVEDLGAGELLITSISHEGTGKGYDINLIKNISQSVNIPVIANGGASTITHFYEGVKNGGASAVAAGSMFVFKGNIKGILINYPSQNELNQQLFSKL